MLDPPVLRHRPPAVDVPADRMPAVLIAWERWWLDALALVVLQEGDDLSSAGSVPRWVQERIPLDGPPPLWRERSHALRAAAGSVPPDDRSSRVDPVLLAVADLVEEDAHRWTTVSTRDGCARPSCCSTSRTSRTTRAPGGARWPPAVALCSFDAALHPVTARVVLRHAFAARL